MTYNNTHKSILSFSSYFPKSIFLVQKENEPIKCSIVELKLDWSNCVLHMGKFLVKIAYLF